MTSLLTQVTPSTKALLWLSSGSVTLDNPFYKDVDYLLNGLLTATLETLPTTNGHILVGENFGHNFYVFVGDGESEKEIKNFFDLIKPQLNEESRILMIDQNESTAKIQKNIPADIKNKILSYSK